MEKNAGANSKSCSIESDQEDNIGGTGQPGKGFGRDLGGGLDRHSDLSPARDAILAQGGPVIAEYPRAVSIGIALLHTIVDQLPQRSERAVAVNYRHSSYDVINQRLDLVASRLSSVLQHMGYRALPIPAAKRIDDQRICAVFFHKLGAHLAELGWIGKSCLLITPEMGPRVRWTTVLTDAPLEAAQGPSKIVVALAHNA